MPANGCQLSQVPIALSRPPSVLVKVTSARKAKTRNAMCRHDSLPVINPILDRCDGAWEGEGSGQVTAASQAIVDSRSRQFVCLDLAGVARESIPAFF